MHGTVHRFDETLDDHPNGRCIAVPHATTMQVEIESGARVFARLSVAEQQAILGPSKYQLYLAGQITLNDLIHQHQGYRSEKTLKAIKAELFL